MLDFAVSAHKSALLVSFVSLAPYEVQQAIRLNTPFGDVESNIKENLVTSIT